MCKNIKNWDLITILYAVFIFIAIIAILVIMCKIESLGKTSTVLAFIGILAAFVIISNYAQLLEVKHDTDERVKNLEENFKKANIFNDMYVKEVRLFIKIKLQEILNNKTKPIFNKIIDYYLLDEQKIMIKVEAPKLEPSKVGNNGFDISLKKEEKLYVLDLINNNIYEANIGNVNINDIKNTKQAGS